MIYVSYTMVNVVWFSKYVYVSVCVTADEATIAEISCPNVSCV